MRIDWRRGSRGNPDRALVPGAVLFTFWVSAVSMGCAIGPQGPSPRVTARDLTASPATFDGKLVSVTGRVARVRLHGGSRSPLRRVLDIEDGAQTIIAVSIGGPACRAGDTAAIEGRFRSRDGVIEASWVTCR
jgi:hypothetical protein